MIVPTPKLAWTSRGDKWLAELDPLAWNYKTLIDKDLDTGLIVTRIRDLIPSHSTGKPSKTSCFARGVSLYEVSAWYLIGIPRRNGAMSSEGDKQPGKNALIQTLMLKSG